MEVAALGGQRDVPLAAAACLRSDAGMATKDGVTSPSSKPSLRRDALGLGLFFIAGVCVLLAAIHALPPMDAADAVKLRRPRDIGEFHAIQVRRGRQNHGDDGGGTRALTRAIRWAGTPRRRSLSGIMR